MGWPTVKLGSISEVITKGTTPTSVGFKFIDSGVNFIKIESITTNGKFLPQKFAAISDECNESLKRSQLMEGDILFSIAGALGRTALVTKEILPANTNQALALIRIKADVKIDKAYLLLALQTSVTMEQVNKLGGGVAQQNLSLGQLKTFDIPLPPIPEQKRIVALLDTVFSDLEQTRAKTEQNLKNARELFDSYLQQVFSQKGEGWVENILGEVGQITSSKRIFKKEYVTSGIPFYRTKEVKQLANNHDISTELFISEERYIEIKENHGIPIPGDILLTAIGTIGEIYVVSDNQPFYFKDGNVLWLKGFSSLDSNFLKYALMAFVSELQRLSQGSTYNALPIQKLKSYSIAYPTINKQSEVAQKIDAVLYESRQLSAIYIKKLTSIDELKKSILQKAFSGELTATAD